MTVSIGEVVFFGIYFRVVVQGVRNLVAACRSFEDDTNRRVFAIYSTLLEYKKKTDEQKRITNMNHHLVQFIFFSCRALIAIWLWNNWR